MKLQLPNVTLVCCDCVNPERAIKVLDHCKSMCDFGDVKFLSSSDIPYSHKETITHLSSLVSYSIFMLKHLHEYVNTSHCLTVQCDGWILNPDSWREEWLMNDYTAPLFMQMARVGSGGCSLRSRRIMKAASDSLPAWDGTTKHADQLQKNIPFYEDGFLSLTEFSKDFKIATNEQGADFGQGGNRDPRYFRERPFSYHRTWQVISFDTGAIDSADTSADITQSYHHIIDAL